MIGVFLLSITLHESCTTPPPQWRVSYGAAQAEPQSSAERSEMSACRGGLRGRRRGEEGGEEGQGGEEEEEDEEEEEGDADGGDL